MWDFEATHPYTWLGGTLIIIIGFLGVLYPLWPQQLRGGVYYLSWGGLGFVGFVIVLGTLWNLFYEKNLYMTWYEFQYSNNEDNSFQSVFQLFFELFCLPWFGSFLAVNIISGFSQISQRMSVLSSLSCRSTLTNIQEQISKHNLIFT